jgi:erythromycin esterase-like protein
MDKIYNYNKFLKESMGDVTYKSILVNNGYIKSGKGWLKKESENYIHFAWLWNSKNSMKMVGYRKDENGKYDYDDSRIYFVSPNDEMDNSILENIIKNKVDTHI